MDSKLRELETKFAATGDISIGMELARAKLRLESPTIDIEDLHPDKWFVVRGNSYSFVMALNLPNGALIYHRQWEGATATVFIPNLVVTDANASK